MQEDKNEIIAHRFFTWSRFRY